MYQNNEKREDGFTKLFKVTVFIVLCTTMIMAFRSRQTSADSLDQNNNTYTVECSMNDSYNYQ